MRTRSITVGPKGKLHSSFQWRSFQGAKHMGMISRGHSFGQISPRINHPTITLPDSV